MSGLQNLLNDAVAAALVELPAGGKFALVIFTEWHADAKEIIPAIAWRIVDGFETCHAPEP